MEFPVANEGPTTRPTSLRRQVIWSALRRDAWTLQWSRTNAAGGLLCLPVIAAWIFVGIVTREYRWTVLAVAGAVAAGFGAFQRLGNSRFQPMMVTLTGIAVGTWAGAVSSQVGWIYHVMLITACGYAFGVMTIVGYGTWWIGLQWMIALVAYGARPASPSAAALLGLCVLAGGASQLIVLTAFKYFADDWFHYQIQPPFNTQESLFPALLKNASPTTLAGHYAVRVAFAMALSTYFAHLWHMPNGYWAPMTCIILLKPDFQESTIRVLNRMAGTLTGAGVTTFALFLLRPNSIEVGLLLLAAVWGCFTLMRVNYALFVICITSYIVLLFSMIGIPSTTVALHRVEATVMGAAIALSFSLLLPMTPKG